VSQQNLARLISSILLPLHTLYAPPTVEATSMLRAGIDSLVASSGRKWLWVHALLIWWITLTWMSTLLWIAWGALAYRRREIQRLAARVKKSQEEKLHITGGEEGLSRDDPDRWTVAEDSDGIRKFRTLMMVNVPPDSKQSFGRVKC
jgi:hypothetical protein